MIWLDTEYITFDGSVQTVIVGDDRVIYVHYLNGYYSVIEGALNLHRYLSGYHMVRMERFTSEEELEQYLKQLER